MSLMKNLGRGALGALVFAGAAVVGAPAFAADHKDGAAATADPASDINDVYSWVSEDKLILAMTVSPFADADATFSSAVQFAFHVDAFPSFGGALAGLPATQQTTVQCEFDDAQIIQCWVHRDGEILDYITGDAGAEGGISTDSTQAFAGLRADPFYFYLAGFNAAREYVVADVAANDVDLSNSTLCPELREDQLNDAYDALQASGPQAQALNDFDEANTLAIVLEIDKSLFVTDAAATVGVHATTHAKPE